jgi:hypothetical protein
MAAIDQQVYTPMHWLQKVIAEDSPWHSWDYRASTRRLESEPQGEIRRSRPRRVATTSTLDTAGALQR